jgi:hypothetical protein
MKGENWIVLVFGFLFLLSVILLFNQGAKTTGYATQQTTASNVTINVYFAIDLSTNLSDGIRFGNISSLPATNQNATHNYDGLNTTVGGATANQSTSMWVNVSTDSNTNVDLCVSANDNLKTSGGDQILVGNETYYNHTATNVTHPSLGQEVAMTTTATKAGPNVSIGSNHYYRFWLDVPAGTASGTFNNTITFKGVATGGSCT